MVQVRHRNLSHGYAIAAAMNREQTFHGSFWGNTST